MPKELKSEFCGLRITKALKEAAEATAERTGLTMSAVLCFAAAEKLLGQPAPFDQPAAGAGR